MKKQFFLAVSFMLFFLFSITAQSRPIMGFDIVEWGASIADVRIAYNISEEISIYVHPDDSNVIVITQENISDNIITRDFMFIDNKLYRVWVTYTNSNDSTARTLRNLLESRFGSPTGFDTEIHDNRMTSIIIFGYYSPDLEVFIEHGSNWLLRVCYTWKKFRDEYMASLFGL